MKQFKYEAKKGKDSVRGILSAENREQAIDQINDMGLVPVELIEVKDKEEKHRSYAQAAIRSGQHSVAVFYRQLGRLLKSGIPLMPALVLVAEQADDRKLKSVLEAVRDQVRQGSSLAQAMKLHPKNFNAFAFSMVELGENTGHLDEALRRLADCFEKQFLVIQKIKAALTYPLLVISLGLLALIYLLTFVVPQFSKLFADLGQSLPFLTQLLIYVSTALKRFGIFILMIIILVVGVIRYRIQNPFYRAAWDRMKLRLPVFGEVWFMAQFSVFCRSMENLVRGGVPMFKALKTGISALSNEAIRGDLLEAQQRVEQGSTLSDALKSFGTYPIFAIHLLMIGEQTGRLEQSFGDIADWYEHEAEERTRTLVQLIEPLAILMIGLALGLVAIAILLPVFSLNTIVS